MGREFLLKFFFATVSRKEVSYSVVQYLKQPANYHLNLVLLDLNLHLNINRQIDSDKKFINFISILFKSYSLKYKNKEELVILCLVIYLVNVVHILKGEIGYNIYFNLFPNQYNTSIKILLS